MDASQEYEKGQLDNDESEQTKISPQRSPMRNTETRDHQGGRRSSQDGTQSAAAEKARMEQIRLEQQEQKRQQGMNCIKIGLAGKLILGKRTGLREVLFS